MSISADDRGDELYHRCTKKRTDSRPDTQINGRSSMRLWTWSENPCASNHIHKKARGERKDARDLGLGTDLGETGIR